MATKVTMEALSPTMEEGRLVKWNKNEGDPVATGDVLAEVETDKAVMELVARGDGVLRKRLANEGDASPVGTLLAVTELRTRISTRSSAERRPQPRPRRQAPLRRPQPQPSLRRRTPRRNRLTSHRLKRRHRRSRRLLPPRQQLRQHPAQQRPHRDPPLLRRRPRATARARALLLLRVDGSVRHRSRADLPPRKESSSAESRAQAPEAASSSATSRTPRPPAVGLVVRRQRRDWRLREISRMSHSPRSEKRSPAVSPSRTAPFRHSSSPRNSTSRARRSCAPS